LSGRSAAAAGRWRRSVRPSTSRAAAHSAFVGAEVRRLDDGRVLYAQNAEKAFAPASVLKLVTTAAALDAFGPDERPRTTLESAASIDRDGRLRGDLYLVGRGDPNLSGRFSDGRVTAAFDELADQLVGAGVRSVEGRLVGHEGLFSGSRRGLDWSSGRPVWWYGAEVSALSFNDNCASLRVAPGTVVGAPVELGLTPVFRVTTGSSRAPRRRPPARRISSSCRRELGSSVIRLLGSYRQGGEPRTLNVAVEDPARYATTVFRRAAAEPRRARDRCVETCLCRCLRACACWARISARHSG